LHAAHQRFDHVHRRITVPLVVKETDEPATAEPAGGLPGSPAGPARCRDRRPGTRFRRRYTDGSVPDASDPRPRCRRDRTGRLREQRGQRADVQRGGHLWFGYLRFGHLRCRYLRRRYFRGRFLRGQFLRGRFLRGQFLRGQFLRGRQRVGQYGSIVGGDPRRDGGALSGRRFVATGYSVTLAVGVDTTTAPAAVGAGGGPGGPGGMPPGR